MTDSYICDISIGERECSLNWLPSTLRSFQSPYCNHLTLLLPNILFKYLLLCFKCATASVKNNKKCSQCENTVTEDNEVYKDYLETLDFLFPPEEEHDESGYQAECAAIGNSGKIYVTTISGESVTITYFPRKTIMDIKKDVEKELKTSPDKQRLIYRNKELKVPIMFLRILYVCLFTASSCTNNDSLVKFYFNKTRMKSEISAV